MSAPDVSYNAQPDQSTLASVVGSPAPQAAAYDPSQERQMDTDLPANARDNTPTGAGAPPAPQSRLHAILSAVASVGSTALAGVPAGNRPSFAGGLGQGARAQQQAQAVQQDIKFKTFDDQMRAAQLHNEDLHIQNQTEEQQNANAKAERDEEDYDEAHGIVYTPHPSQGAAVLQTLTARTAANGAASIAPGTCHSADGETIHEPSQDPDTQKGITTKYNDLQAALNLPSLPQGAQFVPGRYQDIARNIQSGYNVDGSPMSRADIEGRLAGRSAQRDALVQSNASTFALKTFDNLTGIYKANLQGHQDADDQAAAHQATIQAAGNTTIANAAAKTPQGIASLAKEAAETEKDKAEAAAAARANQPNNTSDPFGVPSTLPAKEANSRYNTFSKSYVQPLTKTDQTNAQFQSILSDVNSGKDLTGSQSVVALFDAIGISATPMKGQGFRLNKDVIQEHVEARGVDQRVAQKMGQLRSGEIITPQQIKDYANIAVQARESQYNSAIDEARRQGLPVDFLPKGNGAKIDVSTARMYLRAAGGNRDKAIAAAGAAGWGN